MKTPCPYCQNERLYHLKDARAQCVTCKRKFSPAKQLRNQQMMEGFLDELSPTQCAKKYQFSFPTVFAKYSHFRQLITLYLEHVYQNKMDSFSEYEEYLFLPRSKRGSRKFLIEGIGIMGMASETRVHTFMMPDHYNIYRNEHIDESMIEVVNKELASYLQWNKIAKLESFDSLLTKFWHFLESFMSRYKGVDRVYFTDYLKEAEFRFNFSKNEQKIILGELWKRVEANPKKGQLPSINITK